MADINVTNGDQAEDLLLLGRAGEFILALIQALLRTGYYLPEHPEARKAKNGLYEMFTALAALQGEITFLASEEQGKPTVVIEGITTRPLRLHNTMQRGVAETYAPKFVHFLQRKELIALSLNARMENNEFLHFIDVMSEPAHADMGGATAKEQFVTTLRERQIHNVSFIFTEEFITVRPNVPWRVRLALSRLKKDIHLLPILRNMDKGDLHHIKQQILADILRPLGVAEVLYSFLLNLDLSASESMSEEESEQALFLLTNDRLLPAIGTYFIRDTLAETGGFPVQVSAQKKARILAGLCKRLNGSKDPQAAKMMETLFASGLISLAALPEELKARVLTIKRMTTFLMDPESFIQSVDMTTEPDIYAFRVQTIVSFVPYLVERGEFHEAIAIMHMINRHAEEQSDRSTSAIQKRGELVFGETLAMASATFLTATKEVRTLIGSFFQLIGHGAIPFLQRILIESFDPWRSKQAAETLISIGDKGVASLISSLDGMILSRASIPAVLRTLSELTSERHRSDIVRVLLKQAVSKHDDTRWEALVGLSRLSPASSFSFFSASLADNDMRVRKIAVSGLGLAGDRRGVELLAKVVDTAEKASWPEEHELAVLAIKSLGTLMESCPGVRSSIQAYLGSLVDRYCSHSIFKNFISGSASPPVSLVVSLTETIGKLHGTTMQNHLAKLSQHRNPDVAQRATELLDASQHKGSVTFHHGWTGR